MKSNSAQQLQAQAASPQFVNNREFRLALFGDHPYARTGVTPESLTSIDRDAIVEFHRTYYRPNNAYLLVVGDSPPTPYLPPPNAPLAVGNAAPSGEGGHGAARHQGAEAGVRAASQQRAIDDLGRQLHRRAQRSPVLHARTDQPDFRRGLRFAAGQEHP